MGRLLATDIDGTLLRSDGTVSGRTRQALRDARAAQRTVVLATGRPIRYVEALAAHLEIDTPVVCANGAVLYDASTNEVIAESCVSLEVYEEVWTILRELEGLVFGVETARALTCEPAFADVSVWPVPADAVAPAGQPLCAAPPVKILVRHTGRALAAAVAEIEQAVGHLVTVTHSTPELLEISALGIDKAVGVMRLAAELGLDGEDAIAFGDMPNDIAMLEWAGFAVAVANAHDRVLEVADHVTDSNDNDGVAKVIETLADDSG